MSSQLSSQASKLWSLVSAQTTLDIYKQAITVTWQILKETALLIWLAMCLVLVLFDWIGTNSILAGRGLKQWFANLQQSETDQLASDTGKALLTVGKTGIASTIALAREQLGLPEKPSLVDAIPAASPAPAPIVPSSSGAVVPKSPPTPVVPPSSATIASPDEDDLDS